MTASSDRNQPQRYFFVHMMKTAGSALRRRLMNHFGKAAVYPTELDGTDPATPYLSVDHLRRQLALRGDQIRVVTGHFPLCTTELIGGRWTTLTLLREPVERTLSYLRQQQEIERSDRYAYLRQQRGIGRSARARSLEEVYDDPFTFHGTVHNHMTKMLSLRPTELTDEMFTRVEFDRNRLERAKEALAGVDAVGLQERYEDFCDELAARFSWSLGEPRNLNASAPLEVSDGFRARIAEDNAFDIELYEFARRLLAAESRRAPTAAGVGS